MKRELDKSEKYATGRIRMKTSRGDKLRNVFFIKRDDLKDKKWQLDIGIDEREVDRDVRDGDRVEFNVRQSSTNKYPYVGFKCRRFVEKRRSSPETKRPKKDVKERLGAVPKVDKEVKISTKSYFGIVSWVNKSRNIACLTVEPGYKSILNKNQDKIYFDMEDRPVTESDRVAFQKKTNKPAQSISGFLKAGDCTAINVRLADNQESSVRNLTQRFL